MIKAPGKVLQGVLLVPFFRLLLHAIVSYLLSCLHLFLPFFSRAVSCFAWVDVQGLWRGTTPALGLTVPYCAVQFAVLNHCKALAALQGWNDSKWASVVSFASGSAAGAAATFVSYPFDLLRTVLASQGKPPLYSGMINAARGIVKQNGPQGLFTGVNITLLEIVPYAGIQFGIYDILNRTSESFLHKHRTPDGSPHYAFSRQFLVGFLAGLISKVRSLPVQAHAVLGRPVPTHTFPRESSCITYLDLARARYA